MAAKVTVHIGPAGTGKTTAQLNRYRCALAEGTPGAALWLSPNRRAAEFVRGRLLDDSLQACFSPQVMTFTQFAEAVLAVSPVAVRPLNPLLKRQLIRRTIDSLIELKQLRHFGPIAETDGLLNLASQLIGELKRLEIWPEQFERACETRGMSRKDRELVMIYDQYQQQLVEHHLYDAEGRFWSARELLRNGQRRPFERVQLVVADGFADFTRTQHEILQLLAERVEQMHITLPCEADAGRGDLFAKSRYTLSELQSRHKGATVDRFTRAAAPLWPALDHLERELFGSPRNRKAAPNTDGLEILAATGQIGEAEVIAARIKRLLLQGDADGRTVSPGEIVVVYRSLTEAAPAIREVFTEHGIPWAMEARPKLGQAPVLAALLNVLRVAVEDWPFRQVLSLVGNNYFQPPWPEWQDAHAPAAVEQMIRYLQLPSGREALMEGVGRWAALPPQMQSDATEQPPADGEAEPDQYDYRLAREQRRQRALLALPVLQHLAAALDKLPKAETCARWAVVLAELADELGMLRVADDKAAPGDPSADRLAWDRLIAALVDSHRLVKWLNESPPLLTRSELLAHLHSVLQWEDLPGPSDESGRVRILAAPSTRGLAVPYLFFAGLSEKAIPPADRDDRMYSDAEYQRLNEAGLSLPVRADRHQDEMLLFYEVITRARRQLYLSYPALDESAQPLSPSPYLKELIEACGSCEIARTEVPDLSPIPKSDDPLCPTHHRVKAVACALDGDGALLAGLLSDGTTEHLPANLRAGLEVIHQRAAGDGFGEFEGMIGGDAARKKLASRYSAERLWSASQFEQYAFCPHQFYLSRVLKLQGLEDLSLEVDYMVRGQILHATLARLHKDLNAKLGVPTSPGGQDPEQMRLLYVEALTDLIAKLRTENPLQQAMREIDRRLLADWARNYLEQHRAYDGCWSSCDTPLTPAHFEVSFGTGRADGNSLSKPEPFVLQHAGEKIKLTGRIDRIDVGQVGGRTVFNILDYKTGSSAKFGRDSIEAGMAVQLPLYAIVAEELLLADRQAMPWRVGYWYVKGQGYKEREALKLSQCDEQDVRPTDDWLTLRETILNRLVALVHGIRSAEFPMASGDDTCTSRCDFSTVCRVGHVRSLQKQWQPPGIALSSSLSQTSAAEG